MIGKITGIVSYKGAGYVIVDTAGVGYKVFIKQATMEELGKLGTKPAELWTYLAVKENAMELYGFVHRETLEFFELLLTVTGIGPKTALAILNIAPVPTLRSAIASGDASHLTKTTGIGTKRAERLVMELKDKFEITEREGGAHQDTSDVIEALKALGYSQKEARDALQKLPKDSATPEAKIKQALKTLGRG
ncbi:MAG: Holliday junction DNA helicase RuvA [Candidatus Taylorbacteria bacterium RIFCSPHIGHO2_02_FULL_46_13]|uniref:Holliday junction branch migration complex subunit RuvA n=1 Tax=Candidatus Taylorbacteria bacterium RIFCSPHIGHO2_02_FULL_46_13 TaxID=1802312 RepID=A0A1G2MQM9_9BACT|nr:MAG: Holliday junction DNA helicase RuvA [Candidatus Taylorbacteria bacterium RIFCSPHIGHO2_02_FULL_46_13]